MSDEREINIGPWYFQYLPRSEEAGELVIANEHEMIAYSDFVMREAWEEFEKAAKV